MAAENLALKQQLITIVRHQKRLSKISVIIKPATILNFHKGTISLSLVVMDHRG